MVSASPAFIVRFLTMSFYGGSIVGVAFRRSEARR
jgi:hypothetical protein